MKRKNLTTAIVASIAGVAGISSISNAVNMNAEGVGQILIYPYYSVSEDGPNSLNTMITVVNTTDNAKAVKVRFLEGRNSREVMDFNLYLSEYDVWTAVLAPAVSTIAGHEGELSGKLFTNDTTCTSPNNVSGSQFLPYFFEGAGVGDPLYDEVSHDMVRSREGHFEIIEMGDIVSGSDTETWVTHVAGVPPNCAALDASWTLGGGANDWLIDPTVDLEPETSGGLFGSASIINVQDGTVVSYNAKAVESYRTSVFHSTPGNVLPDLNDGDSGSPSVVFYGGVAVSTYWPIARPIEAFSALFMRNQIYAEYEISASIGAETSYVFTFPTKGYYVDDFRSGQVPAIAPFTESFGEFGACEPYHPSIWDREEDFPSNLPGGPIISPPPPVGDPNIPKFCWETNVINVDKAALLSDVLYSDVAHSLESPYDNGWVRFSFDPLHTTSRGGSAINATGDVHTYEGLPVTGFAVQKYVNGTLPSNVLANYAGLFEHRYSKNIIIS